MSELSNVLLINRDDIMTWTGMSGNVDFDKMSSHIATATDVHLQPILGTELLNKCRTIVKDKTLNNGVNSNYKDLIENYIPPVLVFYSMWDMMPFLTYTIANGGIFQHVSENSATPDESTMNMLVQKFRDKAEFYGRRLLNYICKYPNLFPEYYQNVNGDMSSGADQTFHGITFGM